ncbi:MAG: TIGR03960 family B12-binding radical SAM protein [Candidatus Wallbacteria bacterium]|nr:TIGR03960 family B12-binding radical SAM protein [Candidatus Wallbacteria bacterium]
MLKETDFKSLMRRIMQPGRYLGTELNVSKKSFEQSSLRICLIYPDLYEVGCSNLSLRILYGLLDGIDGVFVDRAFLPDTDLACILRQDGIPLWGLSSRRDLAEFDILGFTVQHELTCSNIVHILKLSGIEPLARKRTSEGPLILAGGPSIVNPEPLSGIFDMFHIGESEDVLPQIIKTVQEHRPDNKAAVKACRSLSGVYDPALYDYKFNGPVIQSVSPSDPVRRTLVKDLDSAFVNLHDIVPYTSIVHDRAILEIQRGCDFGCRFCLAGYIYRPRRERSISKLLSTAEDMLASTGWEELSLSSLSSLCHSGIAELIDGLSPISREQRITLSLPSLRVSESSLPLLKKMGGLKKTGITLVPEAGSETIRRFINKKVTDEELFKTVALASDQGWQNLKLYFMIGFVPESDEDVTAIAAFCREALAIGRRKHGRRFNLSISVAHFVPKPHTPFQWEPFENIDSLQAKIQLLRSRLSRDIRFSYHDFAASRLEAVLARGDRRLSEVIVRAAELGACMDSWSSQFNPSAWDQAFSDCGIDQEWFLRPRGKDEILPWDTVDTGVTKDYLWQEREDAYRFEETPSCAEQCRNCGVGCGDGC